MGVGARGRVVCGETKERTNDEKERRAVPMMNAALALALPLVLLLPAPAS